MTKAIGRLLNEIGDKTQIFRPLQTPLDNVRSYYLYCWRNHRPWLLILKGLLLGIALFGFIGDITDLISGSLLNRLIIIVSFLASGLLTFLEYAANYEKRFTAMEAVAGAYDDILPHTDGWERLDLQIQKGIEPVFRSDAVDAMLRSPVLIPMERDLDYEKALRRRIQDKETWDNVYHPFLQHNYRAAMYHGKQFYNEKKYGLSQGIDLDIPLAKIHKTCYYDTYLTNIIPGQHLTFNRDSVDAADASTAEYMPYRIDSHDRRRLYPLGEKHTSNELGVTTVLIMSNDYIRLWTQNRLAQCSSDLLVASGSGSADWADCKDFFNDPDGFRKAVIYGMERELWEESNGSRANARADFMTKVETRITGYFRWLKKGGKSEFVGVSRLKDMNMISNLSPEYSEVIPGEDIPAGSIQELINSIDCELKPTESGYDCRRCSVSCAMALYALRRTCEDYCSQCPHYDKECVSCTAGKCTARPFKVLFE